MAQYLIYNKLLNYYYRIKAWLIPNDLCLVDLEDNFVLAVGTLADVETIMDQSYGGTFGIFREHELPEGCDTTAIEPF